VLLRVAHDEPLHDVGDRHLAPSGVVAYIVIDNASRHVKQIAALAAVLAEGGNLIFVLGERSHNAY
jgi:hypothetical protein